MDICLRGHIHFLAEDLGKIHGIAVTAQGGDVLDADGHDLGVIRLCTVFDHVAAPVDTEYTDLYLFHEEHSLLC